MRALMIYQWFPQRKIQASLFERFSINEHGGTSSAAGISLNVSPPGRLTFQGDLLMYSFFLFCDIYYKPCAINSDIVAVPPVDV